MQPLFEANAAWAGMGANHGLCEHYRDVERCDAEDREIHLRSGVLVCFTGNELIVESLWVNNAYS